MDFFTKKKLTTWAIVILVILNLSTLATLWFLELKRPPLLPSPRSGIGDVQPFLRRKLGLSEEQERQFRELRQRHFDRTNAMMDEIHQLKKEVMAELFVPQPDVEKVRRLSDEIGARQAELERLLFFHFQDLKAVCKPKQREKFRALMNDLLEMTRPPGPHMRHRKSPPLRSRP